MPLRERLGRRGLSLALMAVGAICLVWVAFQTLSAAAFRERHVARIDAETTAAAPAQAPPAAFGGGHDETLGTPVREDDPVDDGIGPDGVIGVLEIPRLGLAEVVAAGDGDATLDLAIGHLSDTPLPWTSGNAVLAAHRDTHFRPLRHIQAGDLIRLKTRRGVLEYTVRDRLIVDPEDVWVLAPTTHRRLTLVTCYPFNYIGSAPHRFIVQADAR